MEFKRAKIRGRNGDIFTQIRNRELRIEDTDIYGHDVQYFTLSSGRIASNGLIDSHNYIPEIDRSSLSIF